MVIGINGSLCGIVVGFTLPGLLMYMRNKSEGNGRGMWIGGTIGIVGILLSILGLVSLFVDFGQV